MTENKIDWAKQHGLTWWQVLFSVGFVTLVLLMVMSPRDEKKDPCLDPDSPSCAPSTAHAPSDIELEAQKIREAGNSTNGLERDWKLMNEKAKKDCLAANTGSCTSGEDLAPFRSRIVQFVASDKDDCGTWLGPGDEGFKTLQPCGGDDYRKRADILAGMGDLRIPEDGDQRSELMSITIPK